MIISDRFGNNKFIKETTSPFDLQVQSVLYNFKESFQKGISIECELLNLQATNYIICLLPNFLKM